MKAEVLFEASVSTEGKGALGEVTQRAGGFPALDDGLPCENILGIALHEAEGDYLPDHCCFGLQVSFACWQQVAGRYRPLLAASQELAPRSLRW